MKILFMCVANSARSQLAEALARHLLGTHAEVQSAGSSPTKINPFAVTVLREWGIDTRHQYSKSVDDLPRDFILGLDYVITLCLEEVCPVLVSNATKLAWPLPDPAGRGGTDEDQLDRFRQARDSIYEKLIQFSREKDLLSR